MFCILQSFLAGLAASGAITSALRLITKAAFENSKDGLRKGAGKFEFFLLICSLRKEEKKDSFYLLSIWLILMTSLFFAVLFFAISSFFECLCVILYAFVFPKIPIVKYYRNKAASEGSKTVAADLAAGGIQMLSKEEVFSSLLIGN